MPEKTLFISRIAFLFVVIVLGRRTEAAGGLKHPGCYMDLAMLNDMKRRVEAGIQPQKQAFDELYSSEWGDRNRQPQPVPKVNVGGFNQNLLNYWEVLDDSKAASAQALLWFITRDSVYAENAMAILKAQSETLTEVTGANRYLYAAWTAHSFARAAEILRYTYPGWDPAVTTSVENWIRALWYPLLKYVYYTNNWRCLQLKSLFACAIFCDDRAVFDSCVAEMKTQIPKYINADGEGKEICRDLGHNEMGTGGLADACEYAWVQGVDLYSEADNRVLVGHEYLARIGCKIDPIPDPGCSPIDWGGYSCGYSWNSGFGWEVVLNHYKNRMGIDCPATEERVSRFGIDGMLRWGEGMGSLTHRNTGVVTGDSTPPVEAPSGLVVGERSANSITLTWNQLGNAADPESGIMGYVAYVNGESHTVTDTTFTATMLTEGTSYVFRVAGVNGVGLEGPASADLTVSTQADRTPPSIVTILAAEENTSVTVAFDEPLEAVSASTPSNYGISNGIVVSAALYDARSMTVTLTTSAMTGDTEYQLTVSGVKDASSAGNALNGSADFTYRAVSAGVWYDYYEGNWKTVPDYTTLTPVRSGSQSNFSLDPGTPADYWAMRFTARINIPEEGGYTFYTESDDGSVLWIDGKVVVNNDGMHSSRERSGAIQLTSGMHEIVVGYFEVTGGDKLVVSWEGPGIAKQAVPDDVLFHTPNPSVSASRDLNSLTTEDRTYMSATIDPAAGGIRVNTRGYRTLRIALVGLNGRTLYSVPTGPSGVLIPSSEIAPGIYMVCGLANGRLVEMTRVVVR